jgi:hypothetical protein
MATRLTKGSLQCMFLKCMFLQFFFTLQCSACCCSIIAPCTRIAAVSSIPRTLRKFIGPSEVAMFACGIAGCPIAWVIIRREKCFWRYSLMLLGGRSRRVVVLGSVRLWSSGLSFGVIRASGCSYDDCSGSVAVGCGTGICTSKVSESMLE